MQKRPRVSRRAFLGLTLASLLMAGCQKEQIVYVAAPTPTPAAPLERQPLPPTAAPPTPRTEARRVSSEVRSSFPCQSRPARSRRWPRRAR